MSSYTGRGRRPAKEPVCEWVLSLPIALPCRLATRPEVATQVLGIVCRAKPGHLILKAGLKHSSAVTRAVTLIQRFCSALNLNVQVHLLVLDKVYRRGGDGRLLFIPIPDPSAGALSCLVQQIAERVGRSLECSGFIQAISKTRATPSIRARRWRLSSFHI